jgi:segregation and condensation protein B
MELKSILEALIFASPKPLTHTELRDVLKESADHSEEEFPRSLRNTKQDAIVKALEELAGEYEKLARPYRLVCVAGAWQFATQPEFSPWLKTMVGQRMRPSKLSQPALETLAIVAYRQPLTRAEIEQIRGVAVDGVVQTLVERGLMEAVGKADAPGRPTTYGTTPLFLEYFGLRSLEDLPDSEELRRIPIERPQQLVTTEAAPPPEQQMTLPEGSVNEETPAVPAETESVTETAAEEPKA